MKFKINESVDSILADLDQKVKALIALAEREERSVQRNDELILVAKADNTNRTANAERARKTAVKINAIIS